LCCRNIFRHEEALLSGLALYRENATAPISVPDSGALSRTVKDQNTTSMPLTYYLRVEGYITPKLAYTLVVSSVAGTPSAPFTLGLTANSYTVSESGRTAKIGVSRTDTVTAATVDYATSDTAGLANCNVFNGVASARCDYATSVGTLRFAPGETSKTIYVPLVDDNYTEGNESFTLTLSNPSGANLGGISAATITLLDDPNWSINPLDEPAFFITQHYIDFLGREHDDAGYQAWMRILYTCPNGDIRCDRTEVSSAFFRSEEFQSRGYFIYRFYSAVGKIPTYNLFIPDLAKVSGYLSPEQLEANKVAFVNEFMGRADYQTKYGAITDNAAYVNALLSTVGLPSHPGRQGWVNALNAGTSRAVVLRQVVESGEVYTKYYNEAFVIMQYFGYLRRDADISYLQWIQTMNQTNGDYRTMINGFLNSLEYRQRFAP
jgi:hypothetical protein